MTARLFSRNALASSREDLIFVLDDSWDVPINQNAMRNNPYLGQTILDTTRFPSFTGDAAERLKKLVDKTEQYGWKGLGGWICAQEAPISDQKDSVQYWTDRLKEANEAGVDYWKVDWGKNSGHIEWRRMLTKLGKKYAPNLWIEHAQREEYVGIADVYRTYDVFNVVAQPATINRIAGALTYEKDEGVKGLINCEDEPYIAAALGCAIGIMRYPFEGNLPNGQQDFVFPPAGRDFKNRMDEIARGVLWHRIAEPFGIADAAYEIDDDILEDFWVLQERESWCTWCKGHNPGDTLRDSAPARISRGLPLPTMNDQESDRPFVLSSRYPNGAIAIATIGRGLNHTYSTKKVEVEQHIGQLSGDIGIFGSFEKLTLTLSEPIHLTRYHVYAQDILAKEAVDITSKLELDGNQISIPGELIDEIGLSAATKEDLSPPGLVVRFMKKYPPATATCTTYERQYW